MNREIFNCTTLWPSKLIAFYSTNKLEFEKKLPQTSILYDVSIKNFFKKINNSRGYISHNYNYDKYNAKKIFISIFVKPMSHVGFDTKLFDSNDTKHSKLRWYLRWKLRINLRCPVAASHNYNPEHYILELIFGQCITEDDQNNSNRLCLNGYILNNEDKTRKIYYWIVRCNFYYLFNHSASSIS